MDLLNLTFITQKNSLYFFEKQGEKIYVTNNKVGYPPQKFEVLRLFNT